jgi:hypothetical protein
LKNKQLHPNKLLILLICFALFSIFLTKKVLIKEYSIDNNIAQYNENLQPLLREDEVKAAENSNQVCGSPVVVYEGTENCAGGGSVDVDFSENNGGRRSGTVVYSKDLSLKVSKITIPLGILSGSDIPNTNLRITTDEYMIPAASSLFVDKHEDVRRSPDTEKVKYTEYDTWATKSNVSFTELGESSQESQVVVDEYVPSSTQECASCSTNSDRSEKIGKLVNDRTTVPQYEKDIETKLPVLMCKDENSISVEADGVACIDEEFSVLKQITAIFSGSDWQQCNEIEYDDEGNIISDGRCIDIENVVLNLDGIFQNTNQAYENIVNRQISPYSEYNCEMSITFPAWIEIDGKGIYKVSAKMNVPYECWRMSQEFDDTEGDETPTDAGLKAFMKYIESLNRDSVKF